jgi:hypothetical protein
LYLVDSDAAHQYAHAVGIWQDLAYSADLFARLNAAVGTQPRDAVLERGLWTAAVMFYARCFRKGRRYSLSLTVFDGRYPAPAGALDEHQFLMDIAQKDLGRSISIFEQSLAGVTIAIGQDGKPLIVGAGAMYARHHTRTPSGADKALGHVESLRDFVQNVVGTLAAEVRRVAAELPIDEILKGGPAILETPDVAAAGKSRKGPMVRSIPGLD